MVGRSLVTALPRDVPLTPSADEARRWAVDELSKAVYSQGPGLLERFLRWLGDLWDRLADVNNTLGPVFLPLIVLALIAAIVVIGLLVGGPVRRRMLRRSGGSFEVLDGDQRTSAVLRASADSAAARADFALAVLERFRAIVRALDERTVLEDRQGRTAHEAAGSAAERLPSRAADLRRAARLFDEVCYGSATPGPGEDAWLRGVDERVAATKPTRATAVDSPDVWAAAR